SLSGFSQSVYSQTHVKGNIEQVKRNMRLLSEAKARNRDCGTRIEVYFHKYKHNLRELGQMREFAHSLGFHWLENWAYFMPVEKSIALMEGTLSAEEVRFVEEQFALPIRQAIIAARDYAHEPCRLLHDQLVIDVKGNLLLCCGVYDYSQNTLG